MKWRAVLFVGAAVTAIVAACFDADPYVYSGRRYREDAGCLDPYTSIEIVHGSDVASTCPPLCFQFNDAVYTSTVCPPLPDLATALDPSLPECKEANKLYGVTCGAVVDASAGDDDDEVDAGPPEDAAVLDAADAAG